MSSRQPRLVICIVPNKARQTSLPRISRREVKHAPIPAVPTATLMFSLMQLARLQFVAAFRIGDETARIEKVLALEASGFGWRPGRATAGQIADICLLAEDCCPQGSKKSLMEVLEAA